LGAETRILDPMKSLLPADEKRARRRRIAIGVSAVLLPLVALIAYAIHVLPPPRPSPDPTLHPAPRWVAWVVVSGLAGMCAALVGLVLYGSRAMREAREESDAALSLLARGALSEARARFEKMERLRWMGGGFVEVARYYFAVVTMRLGDLDGAIERFTKLQRSSGLNVEGGALACVQLGVCLALSGDLPAAEAWLAEAEKRASRVVSSRLHADQQLSFARVLYDCRRGASADAARTLQSRWRELEASLTGEGIRPWRVLHGFALASSSGPREAAQVEPLLSPLKGGPPGEFAWLGARWPEMKSFLAAYSL
jgi:hypothetical protein